MWGRFVRLAQEAERVADQMVGGSIPGSSSLHAEVFMGRALNSQTVPEAEYRAV